MKPKKGYKGVCWDFTKKKWRVTLKKEGVVYLDTLVDDERIGAKMRDMMILKKSLKEPLQILKIHNLIDDKGK